MNKERTLWITRTAIFVALLVVLQAATAALGNTIITGSVVNMLLVVSVMTCGMMSGLCVSVISPIMAKLIGIGPLWSLISFIAAGNISRANMRTKHNFILWLSLLFSWARKRYGQGQAFQQGRAKVAAAKTKGILIQIRLGILVSSVGQPFL